MKNNKYKILIIEDDTKISSFVEMLLTAKDYSVISAITCNEGYMLFSSYQPDLVILDLGLPDDDGTAFIKKVRETSKVPIMVLSARTNESDKVLALDIGANDYVTKPFGTEELVARIRVLLRSQIGTVPGKKFELEELTIDYEQRKVKINNTVIDLTQNEYNILALLSTETGKIVTYQSIINRIWGITDEGSIKKLQVNMANIRKKMGIKPGDNKYIINEIGIGYRMLGKD